ncbi:hypothetical protein MXB_2338, partial [Myxobolus squamalis]
MGVCNVGIDFGIPDIKEENSNSKTHVVLRNNLNDLKSTQHPPKYKSGCRNLKNLTEFKFYMCAKSACNENAYELIKYDQDSNNCFGIYCKNSDECKIRNDSSKRSLMLSINHNRSYKIIDSPIQNKIKNDLRVFGDVTKSYDDLKCELNFEVEKAKPSKNLLSSSLLKIREVTSPYECVDLCCNTKSCDLVFMTENQCNLINCPKKSECYSYQNAEYGESSKMLYVVRNSKRIFDSKKQAI